MRIIEKPKDSPATEPDVSRDLLKRMVYVPMYPELTRNAVEKMAKVLLRFFEQHPNREAVLPIETEHAAPSVMGIRI
jgi:hypothetical protein